MTRLALLAVAAITLLGTSSATAESYVSLGFGGAETGGDLRAQDLDGSSARLAIGQRFSRLALEVSFASAEYSENGFEVYGTSTAAVDLKFHIGIVGPVEFYLKGGLNKTWDSDDLEGRGIDLGGGLQWNFRLPIASAALWLDYTHASTDLRNARGQRREGSIGMATIGATIGF